MTTLFALKDLLIPVYKQTCIKLPIKLKIKKNWTIETFQSNFLPVLRSWAGKICWFCHLLEMNFLLSKKKNQKLLNSSYKAKSPSLRREKDSRDEAIFFQTNVQQMFHKRTIQKQSSSKHYCLHRTHLLLFHLLCPEDCGLFLRSFYCAQLQKRCNNTHLSVIFITTVRKKSAWVSEWKKLLFYYNPRKKCLVLKKPLC